MRLILAIFVMLTGLSACADVEYVFQEGVETVEIQRDTLKESTTLQDTYESAKIGVKRDTLPLRGRLASFIYPEWKGHQDAKDQAEADIAKKSGKVYCYKTIAEVNCYNQPIKGQEYRIVGTN